MCWEHCIKTIVGPVKGLMNRMNGVCWLCHPILEFFNFDIDVSPHTRVLQFWHRRVIAKFVFKQGVSVLKLDTCLLNLLDLCSIDIKMEDCHRRPWPGQHNGVVTPGQCEYVWCEQIGIRAQYYTMQHATSLVPFFTIRIQNVKQYSKYFYEVRNHLNHNELLEIDFMNIELGQFRVWKLNLHLL